jgi:hypothetical protein
VKIILVQIMQILTFTEVFQAAQEDQPWEIQEHFSPICAMAF